MAPSVNSEDRGPVITRASIAVYAVAVFFVALRFVTRGWLVKKFGLDDLFIGIAVLFGAGEMAMLVLQVRYGRGRHSDELSVDQLNTMITYEYVGMLLYFVANWAVKMSLLALYHRICSLQKGLPWFLSKKVVWTMAAIISAFSLSFFLAEMFSCLPMSGIFDLTNTQKTCIAFIPFYVSQSAINVFIDLVLVVFPLPLLAILQIDRKQRYGLVLVFSIGLLPLVATTVRLCRIVMAVGTTDKPRPYEDTSWKWSAIPVWSQIEVDVGIVAASLPSLNPLLKQIWSGFAQAPVTPSPQVSTRLKPGCKSRVEEAQGFQQLPSIRSSLPNASVASFDFSIPNTGEVNDAKRLTFFDDSRNSEDGEVDSEAFPDPYAATQIGVARTVNTRQSRAIFVEVPVSPGSGSFPRSSMVDGSG